MTWIAWIYQDNSRREYDADFDTDNGSPIPIDSHWRVEEFATRSEALAAAAEHLRLMEERAAEGWRRIHIHHPGAPEYPSAIGEGYNAGFDDDGFFG